MLEYPCAGFIGVFGGDGEVAHLAAGAWLSFSVQVQVHAVIGEYCDPVRVIGLPEVAEQVGHRSRSPGQTSVAER